MISDPAATVHDRCEHLVHVCCDRMRTGPSHRYRRVVLLGGPSSGRTTGLEALEFHASAAGWGTAWLPPATAPQQVADAPLLDLLIGNPLARRSNPQQMLLLADNLGTHHPSTLSNLVDEIRLVEDSGTSVWFAGAASPSAEPQLLQMLGFAEFFPMAANLAANGNPFK